MSKKKPYLNTLLLSGYASIALLVGVLYRILMYEQTAAINQNFLKEGVPSLFCDMGVSKPLAWTICISVLCFLALSFFYLSKKFKKNKKCYGFIVYSFFVVVLLRIIPGIRIAWDIGYFAIVIFVVFIGSWLAFDKAYEMRLKKFKAEVWTLMHQELLQIFQLVIWGTMFLVAGLVWHAWSTSRQDLIDVATIPAYALDPYRNKMIYTALEILFLLSGIILFVIKEFHLRMRDIRERLNERNPG